MADKYFINQYKFLIAVRTDKELPNGPFFDTIEDVNAVSFLSNVTSAFASTHDNVPNEYAKKLTIIINFLGFELKEKFINELVSIRHTFTAPEFWGNLLSSVLAVKNIELKKSLCLYVMRCSTNFDGYTGFEKQMDKIMKIVEDAETIIHIEF